MEGRHAESPEKQEIPWKKKKSTTKNTAAARSEPPEKALSIYRRPPPEGGKETEAEPYRRRDREKREGEDGRGELCEGKARPEAGGIGKKETEEVGIE